MRPLLPLLLILLVLPGCSELLGAGEAVYGPLPALQDGTLTLVNRADRPLVVIAFNAEEMLLVDPLPALPANDFEKAKIAVGSYRRLDFGDGF